MLNLNSPAVQMMLANATPEQRAQLDSIPKHYGNLPTIEHVTVPEYQAPPSLPPQQTQPQMNGYGFNADPYAQQQTYPTGYGFNQPQMDSNAYNPYAGMGQQQMMQMPSQYQMQPAYSDPQFNPYGGMSSQQMQPAYPAPQFNPYGGMSSQQMQMMSPDMQREYLYQKYQSPPRHSPTPGTYEYVMQQENPRLGYQINPRSYSQDINSQYNFISPYMAVERPASIYDGYSNPILQANVMRRDGANPYDPTAQARYNEARYNGISYQEQVLVESNIMKTISRAVNTSLNQEIDEEKLEKLYGMDTINGIDRAAQEEQTMQAAAYRENGFMPYDHNYTKRPKLVVSVTRNGEYLVPPTESDFRPDYYHGNEAVFRMEQAAANYHNFVEVPRLNYRAQRHEMIRQMIPDNVNCIEYFNKYASVMDGYLLHEEWLNARARGVQKSYESELYRRRIAASKSKIMVNGVLLGGNYSPLYGTPGFAESQDPIIHPVIPNDYGDPEVLKTLKINPRTGDVEVNMPDFMKNRIDGEMNRAKADFMLSINKEVIKSGGSL